MDLPLFYHILFHFLMPLLLFIPTIICQWLPSGYNVPSFSNFYPDDRLQSMRSEEAEEATLDTMNSYSNVLSPVKMYLRMEKTMAILEYDETGKTLQKCTLFDLEKEADRKKSMLATRGHHTSVVNCDFKTMRDAINRCLDLSNNNKIGSSNYDQIALIQQSNHTSSTESSNTTSLSDASTSSSLYFSLWRGLIPGTKWCGLGDSATSYDDLGPRRNIDMCCRAHDHCPIRLKSFRIGYGLINLSLYTKSHCDCDEDFLKCLKTANNTVSSMLGNFYFNVLKIQCIKDEKTVICLQVRKNKKGQDECVRYEDMNNGMKFFMPEMVY